MKPLTKYAVPLLAAGLIALTGCSSGDSDSSGDYSSSSRDGDSSLDSLDDGSVVDRAAPESDAPTEAAGGDSESEAKGANRPAPQERAVISKGTVSLRSEDTEKARFDLQKVLDRHDATIDDEKTSTDDDGHVDNARLVVRVPVSEFDKAMADLAQVAELTGSSRSSEDVTTQVIDNKVRIRAQEKSLERVELLLARAKSISDVVSIEAQLTTRQAELDSLKSQQAYLRDQTALSTITIHLEHEDSAAPTKKTEDEHNAFVSGLLGGWSALAALGAGVAELAGALLPFAVVLAVVGLPIAIMIRRMRPRRTVAPDVVPAE